MDEDTAPDMTVLAQRTGRRERAGVDLKKATLDVAQLKVTTCLASEDIEGAKTARLSVLKLLSDGQAIQEQKTEHLKAIPSHTDIQAAETAIQSSQAS